VITVDVDVEQLAEAIAARLTATVTPAPPNTLLDVDGAASYLASTPTAIRSLVKRDAIPYYKTPAGRLLFDREELDAWVREGSP
jgi:excisionase family DNA binding protein